MLNKFRRQLPETVFFHDEVFCQRSGVRHIIVAYLVLMAEKFADVVKPLCLYLA